MPEVEWCICGEAPAKYRVTLTDLEGVVIDSAEVCQCCAEDCELSEVVSIPKEVEW